MPEKSPTIYSLAEVILIEDRELTMSDLFSGQVFTCALECGEHSIETGQIVEFKTKKHDIAENLTPIAAAGSARSQLFKIAAARKLTPYFSPEIQAEVAAIRNNPGIEDPDLVDLEALAFCTIDGQDTQDLDQALHVDKTSNGFVVRYAIADAAYYIQPGSALFTEALKRGASFYLPGLMIPMLPRELCVDVISLNENVRRRSVVFEMHLNQLGVVMQTRIVRSRIRSRGKLSFKEVETFLSGSSTTIRGDADLAISLRYFRDVARLRLRLAEERNVARYHRTEVNVKLGQDGLVFNLLDNVRNEVELFNEQLSLLCNTAGAMLLTETDDTLTNCLQPIYKIHPPPSQAKLKSFEKIIAQLIKAHRLKPERWQWLHDSEQPLSDYLKKLPVTGHQKGVAQTIHRQALMINTRSEFSEQPGRHHGVGVDVYARFSSPMREIVGVFLHKELMEKVDGCNNQCSDQQDEALRQQIIQAANRSKEIQRQLTNEANLLVIDQFFSADLKLAESERPVRTGTILGVGRDKLYILLDEIDIEVKLYIKHLEQRWKMPLDINQDSLCLRNSDSGAIIAKLGDDVEIWVIEKQPSKNRWVFSIKLPPTNEVV